MTPFRISRIIILILCISFFSTSAQALQQRGLLSVRAHSFVTLFFEDQMDRAMIDFDSTLTQRTSAQRLHFIRLSILMSQGPLREIGQPELIGTSEKQVVIIPLAFEKGKLDACIRFTRSGRIGSYAFNPQGAGEGSDEPPYSVPERFSELDVRIERPGLLALPGKLTVPKGEGRFPTILLVQGAGPGGMDAGFGPNRPFRDLAHGLSSQGIVTLRFDRRSFAHPGWFQGRAYTVQDEIMDDVLMAIQLLKDHPKVESSRIYLLGHSLGGMLVPRIAKQSDELSGLILLAAPSRSLPKVIAGQVEYLASLDEPGMTLEMLEDTRHELRVIEELMQEDYPDTTRVLGAPPAYWLDLRRYNQVAEAKLFRGPILILQGMRDFQVVGEDLSGWERAFKNRRNVTIQRFPSLNHLFMSGSGPSSFSEYTRKPGHVDKEVIFNISSWIRSNSGRQ